MSQTSFVMLAYAISLPVLAALVGMSWRSMRKAELRADRTGKEDR